MKKIFTSILFLSILSNFMAQDIELREQMTMDGGVNLIKVNDIEFWAISSTHLIRYSINGDTIASNPVDLSALENSIAYAEVVRQEFINQEQVRIF